MFCDRFYLSSEAKVRMLVKLHNDGSIPRLMKQMMQLNICSIVLKDLQISELTALRDTMYSIFLTEVFTLKDVCDVFLTTTTPFREQEWEIIDKMLLWLNHDDESVFNWEPFLDELFPVFQKSSQMIPEDNSFEACVNLVFHVVIQFEFPNYPVILSTLPFDVDARIHHLLYSSQCSSHFQGRNLLSRLNLE